MSGSKAGNDYKSQVLAAIDIVQLIGQSVSLKKRGKDYVGLCPFHQEKTPSFHVSPAKQYFHCYGCKEGGNAIDFVIKRDRVVFIDALRTLGQMAGIEMPSHGVSREKTSERQQLLEACSAACALFEKLLADGRGAAARAYLEQRGFDSESIKRFQIGFAPDGWDTLLTSNVGKKFPPALLQQAGLVKSRESGTGYYDTFRNRVIFPIRDESGRVIAFGGRVMPESEDPAKYLNSPETPLFSKSRSIFGLDLGRQKIVESRVVAVVEGYTDVVMAHQFGATNVVSILGTAMTEEHAKTFKRYADRVVFMFDPDVAGELAVERALELALTKSLDIGIATLPDGVDPDEYLMEEGVEAFNNLVMKAEDVLPFRWRQISKKHVQNGVLRKEDAVAEYLRPFDRARAYEGVDLMRWGFILTRISRLLEVPAGELNRQLSIWKTLSKERAQVERNSKPTNNAPRSTAPLIAADRAERQILAILLAEPQRWHDVQQDVAVEDFTDDLRRRLADIYWSAQRDEGEPVFNEFLSLLNERALKELAVELVEEAEKLKDVGETLRDALLHLAEVRQRREQEKLVAQLRRMDKQPGEQDEVSSLKAIYERARQPNLRQIGPQV